jgi:predicted RNA-binding Zn-ribbon protein involved in translation (DUF1610 family)
MPVYPLDGGQILRSLLWFVIGRAYSLLFASMIGFGAAVVAGFLAFQYDFLQIPFTRWGIPRPFTFALPLYVIMRSAAAFKQAQALIQLQKMPRIEGLTCPNCGEKPFAGDVWGCGNCKELFNPFDAGDTCPNCGKKHEKVTCPFCREQSEAERWRMGK